MSKAVLYLVLVLAIALGAVPSVPVAGAAPRALQPLADSYVTAIHPNSGRGHLDVLRIDAKPLRKAYLKFQLGGLDPANITHATLRMYAVTPSHVGYDVHSVADDSWREQITLRNAPSSSRRVLASSGGFVAHSWTRTDVTVAARRQIDGVLSLALITSSKRIFLLASRETGATSPQLDLELTSPSLGPAASPSPLPSPSPSDTSGPSSPLTPTPTPPADNTLYVAPTGSNASSCTVGAPCTLDKADSLAAPGTTVRVAAGSYSMTNLHASGTATARIRWVSDTRWGAKMSATGSGPLRVVTVNGAYVDFQGFDVTGSGGDGTVGIDVEGSYSRAIGNHVHNLAISPCGSNGGAGIDLSGNQLGHDQQAIGNLVTDIGSGPRNGTCRTIHGIYASVPGVVIENNITARAVGDGITSWHYATALTIANNTSTQNGGFGVLLGGSVSPFNRGSYVVNNIATSNYLGGIVDCCSNSPPQGGHYLNNLTYGNGNGTDGPRFEGTPAEVSGTVHLDPLFVDAAADDYHLRAGSPGIDSGTANQAPSNDLDGMLRPQGAGFDRGAYEF